MRNHTFGLLAALALLALLSILDSQLETCFAQGTAFTYQGQLQNDGNLANGTYNLQFRLYTNATGGTAVAGPVGTNGLIITNGLFTATIDFDASVWNGVTNWLEIAVETNGATSFTTLAPRQQVTPAPYAITAENLAGTLAGGGLSGAYGNALTFSNSANQFTGSYAGNGGGLTNVNATMLGGLSASNFWQVSGGGPGIQTNGGTGNLNIFTNLTAVASNSAEGWHVTNDVSGNTILDFYGMSHTVGQFFPIQFSQTPGDGSYGGIVYNANHAGGVQNSPANTEMGFDAPGVIALIPGLLSGPTHIQIGGQQIEQLQMFMQANGSPVPNSTVGSDLLDYKTQWNSNGITTYSMAPGWRSRWNAMNSAANNMVWELDMFPDSTGGDNWSDSSLVTAQQFLFGTNSGGAFWWEANLMGSLNGITNSVLVGTNGITMTGNVTAQGGTFSAGIVVAPTNAAPLTIVSNFSPSASFVYTNVLSARIEVAGSISCQAGGNISTAAGSATALINYTNNGVGAAPLEVGSSALGANTNTVVCPFRFDLGPGGTFEIAFSFTGNGSKAGFPQNVTFTIE